MQQNVPLTRSSGDFCLCLMSLRAQLALNNHKYFTDLFTILILANKLFSLLHAD